VRLLVLLVSPLALPIAWVLDRVLGEKQGALFRRAQLKALVDLHRQGAAFGGKLTADEVNIIKGALDLTHKTARQAMTPLDMVRGKGMWRKGGAERGAVGRVERACVGVSGRWAASCGAGCACGCG
jgi:hypothetical protein